SKASSCVSRRKARESSSTRPDTRSSLRKGKPHSRPRSRKKRKLRSISAVENWMRCSDMTSIRSKRLHPDPQIPQLALLAFAEFLKTRITPDWLPNRLSAEESGGDAIVARFSEQVAEERNRFVGL